MKPEPDVLEKEITGELITVKLAGQDYPLAFPIFAVTLYKQETAKLNCRRAKQAAEAGRARVSPAEARELKAQYRELAGQLRGKSPAEFSALMEEAVAIRVRLDEEAGIGDSLFQVVSWWKIRDEDPDRILLALWAALHQEQADGSWKAPFTLGQLNKLVDFANAGLVLRSIAEALAIYMPKVKSDGAGPNAERPESATPATTEMDETEIKMTMATAG